MAAALIALLACTPVARGHGPPVALAFWGDFPPPVAACQRAIGSAAAACAQRAWRLRRNCELTRLRGGTCEESALRQAIQSTRFKAQDLVRAACTSMQVQQLQFLDISEAEIDVTRFCRNLEDAARSVVLRHDAPPASPAARACVDQLARVASKLFASGFRSRQRVLDRIAVASLPPGGKQALVDDSAAATAAAAAALEGELHDCPTELFAALYHGQTPTEVIAKLAIWPDCLAGDSYAQAGVVCPTPVCGNRMIERDEFCDDGNTEAGDGCDARCFDE